MHKSFIKMRFCQCRDPESKTSAHLRACTTHWINTPRKANDIKVGQFLFSKFEGAKVHDNKVEKFFSPESLRIVSVPIKRGGRDKNLPEKQACQHAYKDHESIIHVVMCSMLRLDLIMSIYLHE